MTRSAALYPVFWESDQGILKKADRREHQWDGGNGLRIREYEGQQGLPRSVWLGFAGLSAAVVAGRLIKPAFRHWIKKGVMHFVEEVLRDSYADNLWELISATRRPGPQVIVETNLRAHEGTVIERPLGSPKEWPDFKNLVFNFAQVARRPTAHDAPVDMSVVIGPAAAKPMRVGIPIMISGMAYGIALSASARIALARGAALADAASNAGEGPVLPLERHAARHLILQYNRATWAKEPEILRHADMIEIYFGQGASGGVGTLIKEPDYDLELRRVMGLRLGQPAIKHSFHPELEQGWSLCDLVRYLKDLTGGVPIGVKLAPGKQLEEDLRLCLEAGIDVIALDGAQAATKGSPPILQDDFGIPTVHALVRADAFLRATGQRERVSLIVGGGLYTPGDFLKAIALGADAVYIGSIALFALSHGQVFKSLPWEPPTQIVFHGGHQANQFDIDEAADRLAKFLRSCAKEMAVGIRALGKTSLKELNKDDLMALDAVTAEVCKVALSYRPDGTPASVRGAT